VASDSQQKLRHGRVEFNITDSSVSCFESVIGTVASLSEYVLTRKARLLLVMPPKKKIEKVF
jgi:hypothetical protein